MRIFAGLFLIVFALVQLGFWLDDLRFARKHPLYEADNFALYYAAVMGASSLIFLHNWGHWFNSVFQCGEDIETDVMIAMFFFVAFGLFIGIFVGYLRAMNAQEERAPYLKGKE